MREAALKVVRVKNRVYDGRYNPRRVKSHAEYAVVVGDETVAHIIRNNATWLVVTGHSDTKFGLIVSPLNVRRRMGELKEWAFRKWAVGSEQ